MSKELIVSAGRHETRVAILEDDQVVELFHEREKEYSLAGSIHKGRVTRVLPGMQSAFVDIGLDRDAFLYVSDFFEDNEEYEAVVSTVEDKVLKMERDASAADGSQKRALTVAEPAAELAAEAAPPETVSGEPSSGAVASPSSSAPAETRPEGPRDARGDRGDRGDRGGRGRRGRRRRGGRGSGLPESKFFSPRADAEHSQDGGSENAEEDSGPVSAALPDDFMVLPGESLAKYAGSDSEAEGAEQDEEPGVSPDAEARSETGITAEVQVEAALPAGHPLAGLGEVSSWVNTAHSEDAAAPSDTPETSAASGTPLQSAARENSDQQEALHEEGSLAAGNAETPSEAEPESEGTATAVAETEDDGISASEVAELEIAQEVRAAELFDANGSAAGAAMDESSSADEESTEEDAGGEEALAEGAETAVDEGPEPARIPTSLTATLREQGHRYPHRVSRRMRRKMRSAQTTEQREGQPAEAEPPKPEGRPPRENRVVSQRKEERGQAEGRENRESRPPRDRQERERPPLPSIADLLKEGQEIIVQIAKEPLGQKGARITSHIALPGRFVVYMPTVEHVGVSRKIPSDEERQRLKRILQTHRQGIPGGFICRTAAENKSEEDLKSDMHFLYNLWLDMRQKAEKKPAPVLLHHDLDLVQRILRDQLTTSFKTIWVDNEELYEGILSFVQRFQPALVGRVKLYTRDNPIFEEFGITSEIEKALRPKVWLKSGGYIVINQTEALVAIDINTGKYVGKSNRLEDTIVKINTDAIKEIVRQIRLRDLGGIIVVDFIDMDERRNRQKVMLALEEGMRADRAPYKILQFNDFGLVAITRKRVKQSLERTLCTPCPYCEGAGYIKSVGTIVSEVLQEAHKMRKALEAEQSNVMLRVNPEVAKVLKSNHNTYLQEIEETLGKTVIVKSDPQLHQTKFDLA